MTPLRLGNGDLVEVGVYNVPELAVGFESMATETFICPSSTTCMWRG